VTERSLPREKISLRGASVAIQGFGNAGGLLRASSRRKRRVSSPSAIPRRRLQFAGLIRSKPPRYKERSGTVVGMPGTSRISNDDLLTMKCDILIPAASRNVITLNNADQIKRKSSPKPANGPTTPHADEVLARKGILLLPDILSNAGGVTVSYFEWAQDLQGFFWSEGEVNAKLESVMKRAFQEVHESARKHRTHMRTGAYCLAVGRVADATLVRGLFP